MKKINCILLLLAFSLMSATCEPDDAPISCECQIEGTKQISFDHGQTWLYNGMDERTNLKFPCSYDNTDTEQRTENDVMYKTHWECKE